MTYIKKIDWDAWDRGDKRIKEENEKRLENEVKDMKVIGNGSVTRDDNRPCGYSNNDLGV